MWTCWTVAFDLRVRAVGDLGDADCPDKVAEVPGLGGEFLTLSTIMADG